MSKLLGCWIFPNEIASAQIFENGAQVMQIGLDEQDVANPSDCKNPISLLSFPFRNAVRNQTAINVTNKQFLRFEFQVGTFGFAIVADDRLLFQLSLAKDLWSIHDCVKESCQIRTRLVVHRKRYEDRHGIAIGYVVDLTQFFSKLSAFVPNVKIRFENRFQRFIEIGLGRGQLV